MDILHVLPVPPNACPEDPGHHPGMRLFVGATLSAEKVGTRPAFATVSGKVIPTQVDKFRAAFSFATEPVRVPNTPYYRERVRHGDLAAADAATAAECGVTFRPIAATTNADDAASVEKD